MQQLISFPKFPVFGVLRYINVHCPLVMVLTTLRAWHVARWGPTLPSRPPQTLFIERRAFSLIISPLGFVIVWHYFILFPSIIHRVII